MAAVPEKTNKVSDCLSYENPKLIAFSFRRFMMHHNGQSYNWTDVPNGDTIVRSRSMLPMTCFSYLFGSSLMNLRLAVYWP